MILKISGKICPTMVVLIQQFQKCVCSNSRDIIRYFSVVASEDPVYIYINKCQFYTRIHKSNGCKYNNAGLRIICTARPSL